MTAKGKTVPVGKVVGHYGLKGWLKLHSWCRPREQIFNYRPWRLVTPRESFELDKFQGKIHGKGLIVRFENFSDRTEADVLMDAEIQVPREVLPAPDNQSWYWSDLIGLDVETLNGVTLGKITRMLETGANDVAVVSGDRERLIPWVVGPYVKSVDLAKQSVVVDWDPDF
ncbi:MAG: ribosome maturation factor RimM [Lysobacteraceae bacterium]|nr:MAG: ribosome maturation factor RimM [Xanthomonadaceae bacterium]